MSVERATSSKAFGNLSSGKCGWLSSRMRPRSVDSRNLDPPGAIRGGFLRFLVAVHHLRRTSLVNAWANGRHIRGLHEGRIGLP